MKQIIFSTMITLIASAMASQTVSAVEPIAIEGSSTVYPITQAMAEQYERLYPEQKFSINGHGSSAGFRALLAGDVKISGASRPIKEKELTKAAEINLDIIELPVAFDGITVVVSNTNTFVDSLSVSELQHIFRADNPAQNWRRCSRWLARGTNSNFWPWLRQWHL